MNQCTITEVLTITTSPIEPDPTGILSWTDDVGYAKKPTFWYAYQTGDLIMPDGTTRTIDRNISFESLLDFVMVNTRSRKRASIFLVAGTYVDVTRPKRTWFNVTHGWSGKLFDDNYIHGEYNKGDFTIYLKSTGGYFGEDTRDITGMYEAWNSLEIGLETLFHAPGILGDTPAATGQNLLLLSIPAGKSYSRLPVELREFIKHNITQGREESFPAQRDMIDDGVYVLDGKFFYAGCMSALPVGLAYRDNINEFIGKYRQDDKLAPTCPAFYYVTVTVPKDWHRIGLLKEHVEGTVYPRKSGYTFSNWAQSSEVALLIDNGWQVRISDRIYWPHTDDITDPLETWKRKLLKFRDSTTNEYHRYAIRSIMIHTVGSFHRFGTTEDVITPYGREGEIKNPYDGKTVPRADGIHWRRMRDFERERMNSFLHPEWSATVYGRARAKLAGFALKLKFEDIVALRNDAVWATSILEDGDTSRPGAFRNKGHFPGPLLWPDSSQVEEMARARNREKLLGKDE